MPCSRALHCMCCMSEGFFGEKKCHALDAFSNDPTNLDPTKTPTRVPSGQVLELASLGVSIALAGAGSSTLTNIYLC